MKQKLTKDKLSKFLNKYDHPKELNFKFLKLIDHNQKKRKERMDTVWKDYTIYLYAKRRINDFNNLIMNEIFKNIILEEKKIANALKKKENVNLSDTKIVTTLDLMRAIDAGFGINIDKKGRYTLKIKDQILIEFPSKKKTLERVRRDNFYKDQQKLIGRKFNITTVDEEESVFYKRIMKIKDPKYNIKFFVKYEPKYKKYWETYWPLYLKIR